MYCKNCGTQISDNSKFCGSCGAILQGLEPPTPNGVQSPIATPPSKTMEIANTLAQDGKSIAAKFFTKNPASSIEDAAKSKSPIWVVLVVVNSLLFAFASCLNISQVSTHILNSLLNSVQSMASSMVGSSLAGSIIGNNMPNIESPALWQLFAPLTLLAMITFSAEIAGIYIALRIARKKPNSYANVANVVGVASFPLSIMLTANLIIGVIYPPATLFAFLAAILVNMVLLYEGLRNILNSEKSPIIGFAVIIVILCVIVLVAFEIAVQQAGQTLQDTILSAMGGTLTEQIGPLFSGLFGS